MNLRFSPSRGALKTPTCSVGLSSGYNNRKTRLKETDRASQAIKKMNQVERGALSLTHGADERGPPEITLTANETRIAEWLLFGTILMRLIALNDI